MKQIDKYVALDIDQTLNASLVKAHLTLYNEELGLGMTALQIEQANANYPKVFDVPQIATVILNGKERFEEVRARVRESRTVNMAFDTMPNAVNGVKTLYQASSGNLGYFTVRPYKIYGFDQAKSAAVDWLEVKGFSNSRNTNICEDPKDKIAQVLAVVEQTGLPAILVDDNMDSEKGLLEASKAFSPQKLQDSLTFVGFGMDSRTAQSLVRKNSASEKLNVLGLQSWQTSLVHGLIQALAA